MRSWVRLGMLAGLLLAMAAAESFVHARPARGRQYYSHWSYYRDRSYYYRTYNYAVSDDDDNYQYDYVIYYPTRPRQYYYYNPSSLRISGDACSGAGPAIIQPSTRAAGRRVLNRMFMVGPPYSLPVAAGSWRIQHIPKRPG